MTYSCCYEAQSMSHEVATAKAKHHTYPREVKHLANQYSRATAKPQSHVSIVDRDAICKAPSRVGPYAEIHVPDHPVHVL